MFISISPLILAFDRALGALFGVLTPRCPLPGRRLSNKTSFQQGSSPAESYCSPPGLWLEPGARGRDDGACSKAVAGTGTLPDENRRHGDDWQYLLGVTGKLPELLR